MKCITLAVVVLMGVTPAFAQGRILDSTTVAEGAARAMAPPTPSCGPSLANPNGGSVTTQAGLTPIPGSANPSDRRWYAAGFVGAIVTREVPATGDREIETRVSGSGRLHYAACSVDVFVTGTAVTSPAAAITSEVRWNIVPGSSLAPGLEIGLGVFTDKARATDLAVNQNTTLRLGATTPNLYALTLGPILHGIIGDGYPRFDIRARLWTGEASLLQKDQGIYLRTPFPQVGVTLPIPVLHFPFSLLLAKEWSFHSIPTQQPRDQFTWGLSIRLPSALRATWIVAKRTHSTRLGADMTSYSINLVNLNLGKD